MPKAFAFLALDARREAPGYAEAKPSEREWGLASAHSGKPQPHPDRARIPAQSSLRRLRKLVCDAIHPPHKGQGNRIWI